MTDKQKVLLVDDRQENLVALQAVLVSEERELLTASSGNEALALALSLGNELAVIILDVMMPGMDGFEVAQLLNSNRTTCRIPIIFLTAMHPNGKGISRGYETGAIDFLSKPVDPVIIESKVKVFCDLKRFETQQNLLVEKLKKSNEKLQEISRQKSAFLATASHELRTPLTIIREFVSLVYEGIPGPLNEDQEDCLLSALNNCDRLGGLVNDLLDLQKIKSGRLKLDFQPFELAPLLESSRRDMAQLCKRKNQTLKLDLPDEFPTVCGAQDGLTQILVNLLGNASKFTPEDGNISFRADIGPEQVTIEVQDDGPGIALCDQDKIFQSFTQVSRKDATGSQGTGLGLTIARKIAAMHLSTLTVESQLGQGSTFTFQVPLLRPGLELEMHVKDRVLGADMGLLDYAMLLIKPETPAQAGPDVLEKLCRALKDILRGVDDDVFLVGTMGWVAVLAPVPGDNLEGFRQRIMEGLATQFKDQADIDLEMMAIHAQTISTDSVGLFGKDLETIDFKPLCGLGV